ncbi:thioredoxin [bacterium]|nr:thioredoxin [bacterium]
MPFEINDFHKEVIEASLQIPVLVDFWAEWCGPCRVIGPVLERLAGESDGKWKLVKLNVEQHQDVAAQFGIQSIPAVKLFDKGRVINEFVGALPEPMIRQWLKDNLPSEEKTLLQHASRLLEEGNHDQAKTVLETLATARIPEAQILLAKLLVFDEPERAAEIIKDCDENAPMYDVVQNIRFITSLLMTEISTFPESSIKEGLIRGLNALRKKDFEAALEVLVQTIIIDKTYFNEAARKACIGIFQFLGDDHPITLAWRPRFGMALY